MTLEANFLEINRTVNESHAYAFGDPEHIVTHFVIRVSVAMFDFRFLHLIVDDSILMHNTFIALFWLLIDPLACRLLVASLLVSVHHVYILFKWLVFLL